MKHVLPPPPSISLDSILQKLPPPLQSSGSSGSNVKIQISNHDGAKNSPNFPLLLPPKLQKSSSNAKLDVGPNSGEVPDFPPPPTDSPINFSIPPPIVTSVPTLASPIKTTFFPPPPTISISLPKSINETSELPLPPPGFVLNPVSPKRPSPNPSPRPSTNALSPRPSPTLSPRPSTNAFSPRSNQNQDSKIPVRAPVKRTSSEEKKSVTPQTTLSASPQQINRKIVPNGNFEKPFLPSETSKQLELYLKKLQGEMSGIDSDSINLEGFHKNEILLKLANELDVFKTKNEENSSKLEEGNKNKKILEEELLDLEKKLKAEERAVQVLELVKRDFSKWTEANGKMDKDMEEQFTKRIQELEKQIEEERRVSSRLRIELKEEREESQNSLDRISDYEEKYTKQIGLLQESLNIAEEENKDLNLKLSSKETQIERMNNETKETKSELEKAHNEIKKTKKGLEETKNETGAKEEEMDRVLKELEQSDLELSTMKEQLELSKREVEMLRKQLELSSASSSRNENLIHALEAKLNVSNVENGNLKIHMNEMEIELASFKNQLLEMLKLAEVKKKRQQRLENLSAKMTLNNTE